MKTLQHNQMNLKHDQDYCGELVNIPSPATFMKAARFPHHLVMKLYEEYVCLSDEAIASQEKVTHLQSHSQKWHEARMFHVTASIMKDLSHAKQRHHVMPSCRENWLPLLRAVLLWIS